MVVGSALLHVGALGLAFVSPTSSNREPPRVIAVELVSPSPSPPAPAAAPKPAPAPAPPPEAEVAPPPPPPPPEPKQIVLPEKQTAPKPKEKPKEKPKPREKEVFKEPPKRQEENLDELLAKMRGSEKTAPAPAPTPSAPVETATATTGTPSEGVGTVSPEEAAWRARVIRHMKNFRMIPQGFRALTLQTRVSVNLDATGHIVGTPSITKKSGNPWYDEGVLRDLKKASPLPPPPDSGDWELWFEPGDTL